jgi:cellulose synthase/poly-beta-1,6-N-acetylglucosamine synthase-like glycosyltransferase
MIELSVVLITKNQAWNIARLIESVLQATVAIPSKEIILVDSASTDETAELAGGYPISVVRLKPGPLTPAAGRYIGYKRTQGEFVLFLDGDMELLQGWLEDALRDLRGAPRAGVMMSSKIIDLLPPTAAEKTPPRVKVRTSAPKEVSYASFVAGGAALYRRSVLEQVGTFNPHLKSDEEPELCLRIRHAGYRILLLDYPIVRHYTIAQETISGLLGRRRRKFLMGVGQCVRYHVGSKLLLPYVRERGMWSLMATLWLAAGLGAALWSLIARDFLWIGLWILALVLLIAGAAWRKRSLRRAMLSVFHRLLMVEGLFRGFLMKPLPPGSYPQNAEVIRDFGFEAYIPRTQMGSGRPSPL